MDFMNFMNQFNGSTFGNSCDPNLNNRCSNSNGCRPKLDDLLPLLLLSGLGGQCGNNLPGGNLTCYPNNQYTFPYCGSNIRYKKRKIRQAYVEMPVSTYQVVQPFSQGMPQIPTTMNIIPNGINKNNDLFTILLLFMLINKGRHVPNNQNVGCGVPSEI